MEVGRIEFSPCYGCLCADECMPHNNCMKARSAHPPVPRMYPPVGYAPVAPAVPLLVQKGWICPRCDVVHAPQVERCDCAPKTLAERIHG